MSDSKTEYTSKITNQEKPKNPKRIAAGYKLALISKQAKEHKMRERIENEKADESVNYTSDGQSYLTL